MESKSSYTFKNIISTTLILFLCVFCSFSFDSNAASNDFYLNYAEPSTSDYEGYVTLLIQNVTTGELEIETFFWYCCAVSNGVTSPAYMILSINSGSVTFTPGGSGSVSGYYSLSEINYSGRTGFITSSSSAAWSYNATRWGWKILAYKYSGNIGSVSVTGVSNDNYLYNTYFSEDGSAVILSDIYSLLLQLREGYGLGDIVLNLELLNDSIDDMNSDIDLMKSNLSTIRDYIISLSEDMGIVKEKLDLILEKISDIETELKNQTSWLERIWNSIQEFFNPDSEDKETTDKFKDDTEEQSNAIDDLNEQNKVERPDADSLSDAVDSNLDMSNTADYSGVLAVITNNEYVLQMILISLSLVVVAYILFGKRD